MGKKYMLATQCSHKGGNGQQNAHDLIDHGLAGSADPYGQADKDVAQNAAEEDGNGVDRNLTGGDAHHGVGDGLAVELVNSCHVNQKDNEQGAGKIADPHNSPSLEHLDERDLVALKRADHKRVAGKQLRAANKHEHQPQAKSKATHKALSAPAKGRIAQKDREEQAAKGDERTGEHSEQKGLRDRQVSLGNAGGLSLGLDRGGRQAIGGGIFCLTLRHGNHYFLTIWDKRSWFICPARSDGIKINASQISILACDYIAWSGRREVQGFASLRAFGPCVLRWKCSRIFSAQHPDGFDSRRPARKRKQL